MSRDGLFVYGTLLPDEANGGLVKHLKSIPAKVRGDLYQMPAGYPALHLDGTDWVHGEYLFEPESRLLQILDVYEGVHEGLYSRVHVDVIVGLVRHKAWTYVMKNPKKKGGHRIKGGRWRRANWRR